MWPLNHKRTTSSLAPPIFCVAKKFAIKKEKVPHLDYTYLLLWSRQVFLNPLTPKLKHFYTDPCTIQIDNIGKYVNYGVILPFYEIHGHPRQEVGNSFWLAGHIGEKKKLWVSISTYLLFSGRIKMLGGQDVACGPDVAQACPRFYTMMV